MIGYLNAKRGERTAFKKNVIRNRKGKNGNGDYYVSLALLWPIGHLLLIKDILLMPIIMPLWYIGKIIDEYNNKQDEG